MLKYLDVLVELADFLFKAVTAYAATPEGAKEFADVLKAVDAAAANESQNASPQAKQALATMQRAVKTAEYHTPRE